MTNENLTEEAVTENLTDGKDLTKYNYLVYGGYISRILIRDINVPIRKFLREVIKTCEDKTFKNKLRATTKKLVKEEGVLEHLRELYDLIVEIGTHSPKSLITLKKLNLKIENMLAPNMSDPRVLNAIEKQLPIY